MILHNKFANPAKAKTVSLDNNNSLEVSADKALESSRPSGKDSRRFRKHGYVIHCDGKSAVIAATTDANNSDGSSYWAVGQIMSVDVGRNRVVGLIFKVESNDKNWNTQGENRINIHIELIGEITNNETGKSRFKSGISTYPHLGCEAHRIRTTDLAAIYENNDKNTVKIGAITQDASIPALVSVDSLLSRHFAIVGTTGVGKSTSVALIIGKIIRERPDIRTLILDPHNEFAAAFPDTSIVVDAASLDLPFWMFTLEEFVEVIYRGREGVGAEIDALRDLIPQAKHQYVDGERNSRSASLSKRGRAIHTYTADTPVPYRMEELIKLIDHKIGLLEGKSERPHLKLLKNRIESVVNDPRFSFMFDGKSSADAMKRLLSTIFRIPQNGKPICVFELSGLPAEVVNVVASVMCRLAFDLGCSSNGTIQTLVVCEEAHRYIPADKSAGFLPTRLAIARIAKEGRKYGVYLGVVTQRPGELDTTILSQCNTVFSMRLGSEHDQEIVRKAITGAADSTVSFLSSLANRECIAFGEAIDAPMRMTFENVAKEALPGSNIHECQEEWRHNSNNIPLSSVIVKMCELGSGNSRQPTDELGELENLVVPIHEEQRPTIGDAAQYSRSVPSTLENSSEKWPSTTATEREIPQYSQPELEAVPSTANEKNRLGQSSNVDPLAQPNCNRPRTRDSRAMPDQNSSSSMASSFISTFRTK